MTTAPRRISARQLLGATFSFQHLPLPEVARILQSHGLTRIELWGIAPHLDLYHSDDRKVEWVRQIFADHGQQVRIFTPEQVLYPVNIASGDPAYQRASIDHFRRAADMAAALGARHLFLTAGRGYEVEAPAATWDRAALALSEIVTHAATLGLRCLLEPLQRRESNILHNAADLKRMVDQLNSPTVDVVLDLVAMASAGDSVGDYLRQFGKSVAHVHVVDGTPSGHLVWGDGTLPLGDWINALGAAGYGGTLSFEPFGDGSYALAPARALARNLTAIALHLDQDGTAA